jgi:hypothetical protein
MTNYIHQEIKDHLLKIYHKEIYTLPSWDVIADVIQLAKMERTFENVRFATHVYYVIDDLLHPVKHTWITIDAVNEENCTISIITHEVFENKIGTIDHPPVIYKPDDIVWNNLYEGKTVDILNKNKEAYPISKFEWHIYGDDPSPLDTTQSIHHWVNYKQVKDNYRNAFESVIDRNIPKVSFERFIGRLPEFAEPYVVNQNHNTENNQLIISTFDKEEMPDFLTEIRESFDKKYLKVLLKDKLRLGEIRIVLASLPSVKIVNITKNKELDLTVYPSKFSSVEETQKEVISTLDVIFSGKPADPIIKDDVLTGVSDQIYSKILNMVYLFGENLEKLTNLHSKFDEEGFREYFLPYLNMMSQSHTATGETFNKIGKTDILIQNQQGENVFIAECKVWSGEGDVQPAVDQLFDRYVTWRDEKLALIIFNKSVRGFSAIIAKAIDALQNHPLCKKFNGSINESSGSFIFHHPEDKDKEVQLELIMFNCA